MESEKYILTDLRKQFDQEEEDPIEGDASFREFVNKCH